MMNNVLEDWKLVPVEPASEMLGALAGGAHA